MGSISCFGWTIELFLFGPAGFRRRHFLFLILFYLDCEVLEGLGLCDYLNSGLLKRRRDFCVPGFGTFEGGSENLMCSLSTCGLSVCLDDTYIEFFQ